MPAPKGGCFASDRLKDGTLRLYLRRAADLSALGNPGQGPQPGTSTRAARDGRLPRDHACGQAPLTCQGRCSRGIKADMREADCHLMRLCLSGSDTMRAKAASQPPSACWSEGGGTGGSPVLPAGSESGDRSHGYSHTPNTCRHTAFTRRDRRVGPPGLSGVPAMCLRPRSRLFR